MKLAMVIRKPFVAAILGVATITVPVGALYLAGAARAAAPAVTATAAAASPAPTMTLPDFSTMVQRYGPAVVNITVTTRVPASLNQGDQNGDNGDNGDQNPFGPNSPFAPFFRGFGIPTPRPEPMHGEGSGFIIQPNGVIMTNAHVVNGASEVTVRLTDRREFRAKVIGSDPKSDIAIIKIKANDLPTVKLGDSRGLKVGEWVLAIGAPFGFDNSATAGIVSAKGRTLPGDGYVPFIQTDVPINPGNSGGPLFNMRGEVIGINSQIYSRSGGYQGVSFSIPIDVAMQVGNQLEATGHVSHGKLGVLVQDVSQGLADSFGLPKPEGALVSNVEKGGPAAVAGVQPGDVILKIDGQLIADWSQLPVAVATLTPGTSVDLQIWRNHETHNLSVKLGNLSEERTASNKGPAEEGGGKLGLAVRPLTGDEQRQANTHGGLVVEQSSGPAADAGIEPGDVVLAANGAPVSSAAQLRQAIEKSNGHIALLIQRGDTQLFVPVQVG